MDSRTQTTTEPSVPDTTSSGKRTVPTTNVDSGHKISPGKLFDENGRLPEPKSAPKEVEEPEDPQTLVDRMASDEETTENQKQWEAYNESEWGTYVAQKAEIESITPEGFLKPGEAEEDEHPTRQILANMSFRNGHEVNAHLLMQLESVLKTDADREKRHQGYECKCCSDSDIQQTADNDRSRECCFTVSGS